MTQAPSIISGSAPNLQPQDRIFFLDLPTEIFQMHMVQRLSIQDIGRLRRVCIPMNEFFQRDELFWRPLLRRDFPLQMVKSAQAAAYRRFHIVRTNLIKRLFTSECHGIAPITQEPPALAIIGGRIITGGFNNPISMWDPVKKHLSQTGSMCMSKIEDRMLCFENGDGIVKVMDLQEERELSFLAHHSRVISLAYAPGKLFSGDGQGNIRVWNWAPVLANFQKHVEEGVSEGLILKEFKAHQTFIDVLVVHGDTLISCGNDGTFRFWDLESFAFKKEFPYPSSTDFTIAHGKLIVGMDNGQIVMIDIASQTVTQSFSGHRGRIENLFAFEDVFISEHGKQRKIWDLSTGSCLIELTRGMRPGKNYAYSEGKLVWINNLYEVRSADYLATDDEIFKEIASQFRNGLVEIVIRAVRRFNKMPLKAREAIYLKFAEDHLQYADIDVTLEQWFNESVHNGGKADAIEAYLAERSST